MTGAAAIGAPDRTLFLLFRLGADRYAIAADLVGAVLPVLALKALPGSPPAVAGLIDYRGEAVPVIDLGIVALERRAADRLSTRILLVRYDPGHGEPRWLGLIAEHATATLRRAARDFRPSQVDNGGAPYLGPVLADPAGLIQRIDPAELLGEDLRALLFPRRDAAA